VAAAVERGIQHRLVGDRAARLDAAGLADDDDLGLGVLDPRRDSAGAKPPKTTEWIAPSRAQASIATTASGTIGM
jgi:hypothetical protein